VCLERAETRARVEGRPVQQGFVKFSNKHSRESARSLRDKGDLINLYIEINNDDANGDPTIEEGQLHNFKQFTKIVSAERVRLLDEFEDWLRCNRARLAGEGFGSSVLAAGDSLSEIMEAITGLTLERCPIPVQFPEAVSELHQLRVLRLMDCKLEQGTDLFKKAASLQSITFGGSFNQSLEKVALPSGLQSISFGYAFNQSLEKVTLPSGLQSISFGSSFNRSLENVTLPSGLQSISFGDGFNQLLEKVTLPSALQSISFGYDFNQSLEKATLPSGLQRISFDDFFNQSLEKVMLPSGLQSICFGCKFNQSLEEVTLPSGLQSISFGRCFNQSLEKVTLPSGLQSISFGDDFNQSLEKVTLPEAIKTVHKRTLGTD